VTGNVAGEATAMTVMTPVKKGWADLWLRPNFVIGQHIPAVTAPLRALSFIHFALWAIIDKIPQNGPPQPEEKLNYKYLIFESNFNGTWDQYIDAFSHIVASRMKLIWNSSYGFPGPVPVEPFKDYIERNEFVCDHYYNAYPEATATIIGSSLRLKKEFERFAAETEAMEPEEFEVAYRTFITSVQKDL
jgi:hypothetical protein